VNRDAYPRHLIPPPICPGVRVSPSIYLTCNSYLYFETDYALHLPHRGQRFRHSPHRSQRFRLIYHTETTKYRHSPNRGQLFRDIAHAEAAYLHILYREFRDCHPDEATQNYIHVHNVAQNQQRSDSPLSEYHKQLLL
jgi:hypothetical protein